MINEVFKLQSWRCQFEISIFFSFWKLNCLDGQCGISAATYNFVLPLREYLGRKCVQVGRKVANDRLLYDFVMISKFVCVRSPGSKCVDNHFLLGLFPVFVLFFF